MGRPADGSTRPGYNAGVSMKWTLLLVLVLAMPAVGDGPADGGGGPVPPARPAEPAATEAQVAAIVSRLGHADYEVREQAQRELEALPTAAMPWVVKHHTGGRDAEVRLRIRRYAGEYFRRNVLADHARTLGWPAFLGIQTAAATMEDGGRMIIASEVIEGTAAEDAGLIAGDHIVAYDGQPLPATDTVLRFSQTIRQTPVGTRIKLTVERAGKRQDLTVTLGPLPAEHLLGPEREAYESARKALWQRWWSEAFLKGRADLPPEPQGQPPAEPERADAAEPPAPTRSITRVVEPADE